MEASRPLPRPSSHNTKKVKRISTHGLRFFPSVKKLWILDDMDWLKLKPFRASTIAYWLADNKVRTEPKPHRKYWCGFSKGPPRCQEMDSDTEIESSDPETEYLSIGGPVTWPVSIQDEPLLSWCDARPSGRFNVPLKPFNGVFVLD